MARIPDRSVTTPDGKQVPLQVSLISVNNEVEVEPKPKKNSAMPELAASPKNTSRPRRDNYASHEHATKAE